MNLSMSRKTRLLDEKTAASGATQHHTNKEFRTLNDGGYIARNSDPKLELLGVQDVKKDQVIKPPSPPTPATDNQSYSKPRHDDPEHQRSHIIVTSLPKSPESNDLSTGSVISSRSSPDVHEHAFRPGSVDEPNPTTPDLSLISDITSDFDLTCVNASDQEASNSVTTATVIEPPSSDDCSVSEPHLPSSSVADEVVIDLNMSFEDTVYPFNNSGLLVGFPHKVEPSRALQTRWKDEIEPRLCHDVEAFQRRTKPVIRKGRVNLPRLSVELRMSGHVKVGRTQVTLVPTIWFLYDEKRWGKDVRRFVAELEWLSGEGFGDSEVQKGFPRLTNLRIPVDKLHISALGHDSISLPDGGELYIHAEEPQSTTACGLLYCATFVQDGKVSAQYVSRIGGLVDLDTRTSAVTTAHGFVEEISSRTHCWYTGYDTGLDQESGSDDDDELPGLLNSENHVGQIDSAILDAVSWFQVSPTSIQETCLFDLDGSTIHELLLKSTGIHAKKVFNVLQKKLSATALQTEPQAAQTGDFSFLSLNERDNLHNYYQAIGNGTIAKETVVYRIAERQEVKAGPVHLLLRPGKASQATLLPGTMLFSPYDVPLQACKVVLDRPLALGCSGTWVVHEGLLYGTIIASYECEPLALMLPSFYIARDIRSHFPYISTIRLPGVRESTGDYDLSHSGMVSKSSHQSLAQNKAQSEGLYTEITMEFQSTDSGSETTTMSVDDQTSQTSTSMTSVEASIGNFPNFPTLNHMLDVQHGMTGPPMGQTITWASLLCKPDAMTHIPLIISIHAVIDKGFFLEDDEWTSYRRNYFACTCSYTTSPRLDQTVYLEDPLSKRQLEIHKFLISISAVDVGNKSQEVQLVQNTTARREKELAVAPGTVTLGPHQNPPTPAWKMMPTEHHFERLQFKLNTLNDKKRMELENHYCLIVELWADIGEGQAPIRVASAKSARLTVRGRSPGHYQDERDGDSTPEIDERIVSFEIPKRNDAAVLSFMKERRTQKRLNRSRAPQGGSPRSGKPANDDFGEKKVYLSLGSFGIV